MQCMYHVCKIRIEQGPGPPENSTRPEPTRKGLDGSDNNRVGFRVSFSGYFRVRVGIRSGVGSDKNTSLNPIFSFESNPTLLSVVVLSPPPSALRLPQGLSYLCVSHHSRVVVFVCVW